MLQFRVQKNADLDGYTESADILTSLEVKEKAGEQEIRGSLAQVAAIQNQSLEEG